MTDKKEVSILLLGIVAILAIVGLVLLFTSVTITGNDWFPPQLPPNVETPAPIGYDPVALVEQSGIVSNVVLISALEASNLARCPNGRLRTREQGNIPYQAIPGHLCSWFYCAGLENSPDPLTKPLLGCVRTA